jgi:hypothetical protein
MPAIPTTPDPDLWRQAVDTCPRCNYMNFPDGGTSDESGVHTTRTCINCKLTFPTYYSTDIVLGFKRLGSSRMVNQWNKFWYKSHRFVG